jgi:MFS family permease
LGSFLSQLDATGVNVSLSSLATQLHSTLSVIPWVTSGYLLALVLGPVIAGAILQFASWRWLFLLNLPVGALAIVLVVIFLPNDQDERKPRELDLVGLALLSPGLALFLHASDHVRERAGVLLLAAALGQSCVGVPTISAAYSSVTVQDLRDPSRARECFPVCSWGRASGASARSRRFSPR